MQEEIIEGYRLSPQQKELWLAQQASGRSTPYRAQLVAELAGPLDARTLEESLRALVARHEILRTTFQPLPGVSLPVQVVGEVWTPSPEREDLSGLGPAEQAARLEELASDALAAPLDFERGPLMRVSLVKLADERHRLLLTLPSMCADAAALRNLLRELSLAYSAHVRDERLDDEPLQYSDLAGWLNELLEAEDTKAGRDFWRAQDVSGLFALELPFDAKDSGHERFHPSLVRARLGAPEAASLDSLAERLGVPTSLLLLACWQILLARHGRQEEFHLGVGFDGRKYQELEEAVGLFARHLPVACRFEADEGLAELLARVSEATGEAYKWQESFTWEGVELPEGATPFCPFGFDFDEHAAPHASGPLTVSVVELYACTAPFRLKLSCARAGDRLALDFRYDSSLYDDRQLARLAERFRALLASVVARPESAVGDFELLGEAERQELLSRRIDTTRALPHAPAPLHLPFELRAAQTPDDPALIFRDTRLSYAELNARANRLARHLRALGVGPEVLVAICFERSAEMVVALLSVLKAGGAYVPIDPQYPAERVSFMLEDSRARVLLTQSHLLPALPEHSAHVFLLDSQHEELSQHSSENLGVEVDTSNLAYVIYTSGSTGRPKAVGVSHANASHSTAARLAYYKEPVGGFLLIPSLAFDSSVAALFWALWSGGALLVPQEDERRDPRA
ncbi:MAG TPA: condensation domain-containing protein, partial [Pyrinomonadaceae bacterium]|nr:condensation domain-containing protein [Pyrinomonadaceae bacterium]